MGDHTAQGQGDFAARMKANIKISSIIPTCDRPQFLPEAIASIHAQSLQPIEIIVVNNGDKSITAGSLGEDVKILNLKPYLGVSAARNAGAEAAKGEFLAFLDDDDTWDKDFLKHLAVKIKAENASCAFGTRVKFFPDGKTKAYTNKLPQNIPTSDHANFYKAPGFGGNNFLVSKRDFFAIGGFDKTLRESEDQDLFVRIALACLHLTTEPNAICQMRQHHSPRLRYAAPFKGLWPYYSKHRKNLNFKQHLNFLKEYSRGIRKLVFRILKLKRY